jgi:chromate transporter
MNYGLKTPGLWTDRSPLVQVGMLFLRLGATAFGGPAAHIALIERECVQRRAWMTRQQFLDVLGVANLIPGPTSTELAMHVGRLRAGFPGLVVAGVAFVLPAAVLVGMLAALYVAAGDLPVARGVRAAIQPVVVIMVLQAIGPIGRSALRSVSLALLALLAATAALAGISEILVLLMAGVARLLFGLRDRHASHTAMAVFATVAGATVLVAAEPHARVAVADVAGYFVRVGSLLFGSGYVLLPVLRGDLVDRLGWLTDRELLDAVATGQATPGPLFTTATFIGYLLGGPMMAMVATLAMFAPAFVFSALSSMVLERLRASRYARAFLDGVNAAAVALIVVVLITLGRVAFARPAGIAIGVAASLAIFVARVSPMWVLLAAAVAGGIYGVVSAALI